jgi:hypothetical protein
MRPVNLLPQRYRAHLPSGGRQGSAYLVLGVLAALLVAVAVYVLTANQVNSRKTDIAKAKAEAAEAEARAAALGPFGKFVTIKETRLASVKQLAGARFDWERLMRELALVLPSGVWLSEVTASATGQATEDGPTGAGSSPPSDSGTSGAADASTASPSVKLVGCATAQPKVAVLLVRLRRLHRALDVQLSESAEEEAESSDSGSSSDSSAASSTDGCGKRRFKFDATVTFSPLPASSGGQAKVPASLGGGS